MKKRILTIALVLACVMAFLPLSASAAVSKYDGTKSTELRKKDGKVYIDSAADLAYWASSVSSGEAYQDVEVLLTTDIVWNEGNAADWKTKAPANKWVTAGGWSSPFKGIFDGQGHKISGLYMNADNGNDNLGFIGSIQGYVTVKNLVIDNSYFTFTCAKGNANVGLVGVSRNAELTVENVMMDAIIEGPGGAIGMFVGRVHTEARGNVITIKNSVATGSITAQKSDVGGFVGQVAATAGNPEGSNDHVITIENSLSNVTINAKSSAAGIVGGGEIWKSVDLKNVVSLGKVTTTEAPVGALTALPLQTGNANAKITATNAYYLKDSASVAFGSDVAATATAVTADQLKGDAAKTALAGFDFNKTWTTVADGYPMPASVAAMLGLSGSTSNPGTSDLSVVLLVSAGAVAVLSAAAVVLKRKYA